MATRTGETLDDVLYAPLEVNKTGMLKVSSLHTVYWEESGNSAGLPVMVLRLFHPKLRLAVFATGAAWRSRRWQSG